MFKIFLRDLKVNAKSFLSLYIFIAPLLFVLFINVFVPTVGNTTVHFAMVEGEHPALESYLKDISEVSLLRDIEHIKARVAEQDDVFGVYEGALLVQGNEAGFNVELAKRILGSYGVEDRAEVHFTTLGVERSSLKSILVSSVLLFVSVIGGMLITLNIVEEKQDKTIKALQVTPLTNMDFLLGKSVLGLVYAFVSSLAVIYLTGFGAVNVVQVLFIILLLTLLSLIIGMTQGLYSEDVMEAIASVKMLFIPILAGVLPYQLLGEAWQKFFYWNPFYWAYKGVLEVLQHQGSWPKVLLSGGIVFVLTFGIFMLVKGRIQSALE